MKKDMNGFVKNIDMSGVKKLMEMKFSYVAALAGTIFYLSAGQTALAADQSWHNPEYNLSNVKSITLTQVNNESKTVVGRPSRVNPEASYSSFVTKDKAEKQVADIFLYTAADKKYKVNTSLVQEDAVKGDITNLKSTENAMANATEPAEGNTSLRNGSRAAEKSKKALKVYSHKKDKKGRIEPKELTAKITLINFGYAMTVVPAHEETKVAYVRKTKKAADKEIVSQQQTVKVEDGKVSSTTTVSKTEVKRKHDNFFSDDFNDFMDDFHNNSIEDKKETVTDELLIPVPFTEKVPERKFYTAHVELKYELFDALTGEKVYMATDHRARAGQTRTESMLERSIKAMLKDMKKH